MEYKLGRKAIKWDSRTLKVRDYLTPALPAPPVSVDWTRGIISFGEMLNDQLGDCVFAGIGHAIQIWTANTTTEATVPDSTIESYYESWAGYDPNDPSTDQGYIELDALNKWKKGTFAGHKLLAYADATISNIAEVKQAINLFGGVYIGLNVPNFIMNSIPSVWDVVSDDGGIDGGHCVYVVGYDADTIKFISWGSLYSMTTAFWNKYVDEAHALLSQDWIDTKGVDPQGFNLAQLEADLAAIR